MLTRVQDVLINLGEIQRYLASAPNARESIPPIPLLGKDWVEAGNDESPEFFIAAALAGLHAEKRVSGDVEGRGSDGMRMATHFAPVTGDYSRHDSGWWEESREVVWSEGELDRALLAVLERRLLRAEMDGNWEKPLESDFGVPLHSVEGWLAAGKRFDRRIADLLQGLVLARIPHRLDGGSRYGGSENVVLPAAYFLLKPFFATERRLRAVGALGPERLLPLPLAVVRMIAAEPGWMKKDQPEQGVLPFALRRLHLAGVGSLKRRDKGRSEEDEIDGGDARLSPALSGIQCTGVEGRRLLAALLVPISNADLEEVIRRISMPPRKRRSSASAVQP
jgi:CRISPR-associated protein Csx17